MPLFSFTMMHASLQFSLLTLRHGRERTTWAWYIRILPTCTSGALLQGPSNDMVSKIHEERDYPGVLRSQLTAAGEASYALLCFNSMFRNLMWIAGNCPFWVCLYHWSQQAGSFPKSTKLSHMSQQGSDVTEGLLVLCMVSDQSTQYALSRKSEVGPFSPQGSAHLIPHSTHTSSVAWLSGPVSFSFSLRETKASMSAEPALCL